MLPCKDNVENRQYVRVRVRVCVSVRVCLGVRVCVPLRPHYCGILIYGNLQVKCPQR